MATATRQVSELLPSLATELPGCGEADKLAALERALRDFCERSRVWRVRISVTGAAGDLSSGALTSLGCGCRLLGIDQVEVDGTPLQSRANRSWSMLRDDSGCYVVRFLASPNESASWTLEALVTLAPGSGAEVPTWIIADYGDAIASGALAICKRHVRKPYTDFPGADLAERDFRRGIARAAEAGALLARRER